MESSCEISFDWIEEKKKQAIQCWVISCGVDLSQAYESENKWNWFAKNQQYVVWIQWMAVMNLRVMTFFSSNLL